MQHLTPERLAALADEPATLVERTHLAECAECVAELSAAQRLMEMALTDTPAIERPITSWERLAPALRAEGLIDSPAGVRDQRWLRSRGGTLPRRALQAAAGVFLVLGGAVVGRASSTAPLPTVASANDDTTRFESTSDAIAVLDRAANQYQRAVAYLATNDSSLRLSGRDAAELYQTRLEALDQTQAAIRAALYRAPRDPVLNQYYLQTQGVRNLTLQQMGNVVSTPVVRRTF